MKFGNQKIKQSRQIRLEASTVCQLKCPSCPTASGAVGKRLGLGNLKLSDFKNIIGNNPHVAHIQLSNWGEIFLNNELIDIMKFAYKNNISLSARGANLNNVDKDVLEALVKYRFREITCSIDGASQEIYSIYRVRGNFQQVIENIKTINKFKAQYHCQFPILRWQFVAFGHNEHEISRARKMAKDLKMGFFVKLSWEDLYSEPFSPIKNSDLIKKETGLGISNRGELREKYGREFNKNCCLPLWTNPQINYDGRVLGCCVNFWDDYGNAFKDGLEQCLNNQKITYAREMLMGKREKREDIPCAQCKVYKKMQLRKNWITYKEVKEHNAKIRRTKSKTLNIIEGKILRFELKNLFYGILKVPKGLMRLAKRILKGMDIRIKRIFTAITGTKLRSANQLNSWSYHLQLPLEPDVEKGWKPYFLFRGFTSEMKSLACHASTLIQGHTPHHPHMHKEEEILLLLDGEVDIIISDGVTPHETKRRRLKRGEFVYYPSNFAHTLQTMSEVPANYMMYKWYAHSKENKAALNFGHYKVLKWLSETEGKKGFCTHLLFEGPTVFLKKLHCHITSLSPQAGYEPHVDDYDVSIIVLEGEIETLGKRIGPHSVIYYAAGEPHGMYNPGEVVAKYIVFEFHGHPSILVRIFKRFVSLISRLRKKT